MTDMADGIEFAVKDAEQYGFRNIVIGLVDAKKIIAALRRGPEPPPSGEMVMVPREPTEDMRIAGIAAMAREQNGVREIYRAMLSAAEAKGRKPCPLCGRTDPHSHTSGPLGMS